VAVPGAISADDTTAAKFSEYFELADHYADVSFDVGPLATIKSPDSERYRDLTVATHQGKLRVGLLDDYDSATRPQPGDRRQAKIQVAKRLLDEEELYLGLLAFQWGEPFYTKEWMLDPDPNAVKQQPALQYFQPLGYASAIAYSVATTPVFKDYFCTDKPSCWDPQYRQVMRFGVSPTGAAAKKWQRNKDEFAVRDAIEKYIATDLQPLLAWSRALSPEIVLVDRVLITEYDFAQGGFAFDIAMPQHSAGGRIGNDVGYFYHERPGAAVQIPNKGLTSERVVLKMAPGDAETLVNDLKEERGNDLLYFTLQARLYNMAWAEPSLQQSRYFMLYELQSPEVVFYRDLALKKPLGSVSLTP
tara:strand:+ start:106540 stop:107619 length:1080 start_codon:yes stop_codon:yes gene_type:complete